MTITNRIREAYKASHDPVDRAGIAPFYASGWWFDLAAREHDQAYIRIAAEVTDETYEVADINFAKNIMFLAGNNPIKIVQARIMIGIVNSFTRIRSFNKENKNGKCRNDSK